MNKRNTLLPVTLIILTIFLFSCASMSPNSKILVGSWKPVYAEKYIDPKQEKKPENKSAPADTAGMALKATTAPAQPNAQQRTNAEWDRMVNTEKRTPLVIKADKTLEKAYHQRTVKGTWKLKHNGKRLIMTESTTGQKLKADITEISDSVIVVIERLPVGDIKVKYVKVQ